MIKYLYLFFKPGIVRRRLGLDRGCFLVVFRLFRCRARSMAMNLSGCMFNRTHVLPVTCVLRKAPERREVARLSEDKLVPEPSELSVLPPNEREAKILSFLVNSIGATCRKLISQAGVTPTVTDKGMAKTLTDKVEIEVSVPDPILLTRQHDDGSSGSLRRLF